MSGQADVMDLSIIIPSYNEQEALATLLPSLPEKIGDRIRFEILVCDAYSTDGTVKLAQEYGAKVILSERMGRAVQLNAGAALANGKWLYFLHADSTLPPHVADHIFHYIQLGYQAGCFRLGFDRRHWVLNFSSWVSRFNLKNFQFGDQSLFVSKSLFDELGAYDENCLVMEDVDLVSRLKKRCKFVIMPYYIVTSSRKYGQYGVLKTEIKHFYIYLLYLAGVKQEKLLLVYRRLFV